MSLEVGRIIRGFGGASTFNFKKLKYKRETQWKGHQVSATTHSAPMRSSAARAAHRRQASSYICFGPIIPEPLARAPLGVWLEVAEKRRRNLQYRMEQKRGRALMAQAGLARNKCRSWLAGDAPRGRRSISLAPEEQRRAPFTANAIPRRPLAAPPHSQTALPCFLPTLESPRPTAGTLSTISTAPINA